MQSETKPRPDTETLSYNLISVFSEFARTQELFGTVWVGWLENYNPFQMWYWLQAKTKKVISVIDYYLYIGKI